MAGRPKKEAGSKMDARVPFVALPSEKIDYEWARGVTGFKHISEWVRDVLNKEVARLQKKHKR